MSVKNENEAVVRCGGVPEHFNLPWVLASKSPSAADRGINIQWNDYASGTGAMCQALRNNELDMAVLLTEGAVTDILHGNPSRILTFYMGTPLTWGVYTGGSGSTMPLSQFENCPFAISRYKSGSHLMAYLYADQKGWELGDKDFKIVYGLEGACNALRQGSPKLFLWEKFITLPHVRSGELIHLDDCPTPWPATVVVVRNEFMKQHADVVHKVMDSVRDEILKINEYTAAANLIAGRYNLLVKEAEEWLSQIEWLMVNEIDVAALQRAHHEMHRLGVLNEKLPAEELFNQILFEASWNERSAEAFMQLQ